MGKCPSHRCLTVLAGNELPILQDEWYMEAYLEGAVHLLSTPHIGNSHLVSSERARLVGCQERKGACSNAVSK